jgi:hypothetical protein
MRVRRRLGLALAAIAFAPAAELIARSPALAQQSGSASSQPDLVPVVLWTFAIVCLASLLLSLGYLYQRARGVPDEIIPANVDTDYADGPGTGQGAGSSDPVAAGAPHGAGH